LEDFACRMEWLYTDIFRPAAPVSSDDNELDLDDKVFFDDSQARGLGDDLEYTLLSAIR